MCNFGITLIAIAAALSGCADREAARRDAIAEGIQHCAAEGKMFVFDMAMDKDPGNPFSPVVVNGYCLTREQFRAAEMVPDPAAAALVRQNQMQQQMQK